MTDQCEEKSIPTPEQGHKNEVAEFMNKVISSGTYQLHILDKNDELADIKYFMNGQEISEQDVKQQKLIWKFDIIEQLSDEKKILNTWDLDGKMFAEGKHYRDLWFPKESVDEKMEKVEDEIKKIYAQNVNKAETVIENYRMLMTATKKLQEERPDVINKLFKLYQTGHEKNNIEKEESKELTRQVYVALRNMGIPARLLKSQN